jgi:anti-sigma factor RsiW
MKWRCTLLQRWLPGYLDGDLPAFWQRRLGAHLKVCPQCRQDLEILGQVVDAVKAAPVADPGPEFWQEFSREMHLKLAQAAQTAPAPFPPRRLPLSYYLLGAPALAVLLLWLIMHFTAPHGPLLTPPQMAQTPKPPPATQVTQAPATQVPQAPAAEEQFVYASMAKGDVLAPEEDDFSSWDIEPVIADLTDQERKILLNKLRLEEKNGSCVMSSSSVSWA